MPDAGTGRPAPPGGAAPPLPDRVTLPLLTLITQQSLDEDYLHAAERRASVARLRDPRDADDPAGEPGERPTRNPRRLTAVVIAVFGVLVTTAAVQTSRNAGVEDASRSSLIDRIVVRRERVSSLQDQIVDIRTQVAALEKQGQQAATDEQNATTRLRRLQVRTGFIPVTGQGVRITVASADDADPGDRVNDADLALLTNGLWEAGAEAISINGQRLTALGAIGFSGQTILVNRMPISPPYVVLAIGDTRTLQADLADTTSGQAFADVAQNLDFTVTRDNADRLSLPAATLRTLRDVEVATPGALAPPQEGEAP